MTNPRAIIFTNGNLPDLESARRLIQPVDTLIAADGGTRHVLALNLTPSVIIGDLDSLSKNERQIAESAGSKIVQYPRYKNETDLELALDYAIEKKFRNILVVGALGGRLDQTLGNLSLLANSSLAGVDIRLDDGVEEAYFVRAQAKVQGRAGDIVSLIPWGGKVTGIVTDGLHWPLDGETLYPNKTRGISNELLGKSAFVSLKSGLLLLIHRRNQRL